MNIIQKVLHNKTIRNGSLFSLYSFFQKGVSFILLIILAKFVSPTDYGEMNLFNTATMLIGYFVGLNTAGYLSISYFANKRIEDFKKDFTTIILISLFSSILLCVCILPFLSSLAAIISISPLLLIAAFLLAFLRIFLDITLNYYRVQEKVINYGVLSCTNSLLTALLVLFFVLWCKQGWHGYVEGQLLTLALISIISLCLFKKWELYTFKGLTIKRFKTIILWGIPLIPHLATTWIRQGMDRYIIENNHTTADVGIFSFALNLTNIIIMIGTSFNNTFSVNIFKTLSLNLPLTARRNILKKQNTKIFIVYIVSTILIVLGVTIFIPIIMPNYTPAIKYFIILSLYGIFQCFYFQYCNYFFYYKKTKTLMHITFLSSLLHLSLSWILTPFSLIFTCWIYVIIQILIVVMTKKIGTQALR